MNSAAAIPSTTLNTSSGGTGTSWPGNNVIESTCLYSTPLPGTLRIYGCMSVADRNNPVAIEIQRKNWLESYKYNVRDLDLMRGFYSVFGTTF